MTVLFVFLLLSLTGCLIHFAALKEKRTYKLYQLVYVYLTAIFMLGNEMIAMLGIVKSIVKGELIFSYPFNEYEMFFVFLEMILFLLTILILCVKERWKEVLFGLQLFASICLAIRKLIIKASPVIVILMEHIMMPCIILLFYLCYRQSKRAYVRYLFERKSKIYK